MNNLKYVSIFFFFLTSLIFSSCSQDTPKTQKVSYIVTGDSFDVIYKNGGGEYEYIYGREDFFKVYVDTPVDEPLYLLAKGSDNLVIRIHVKDILDTVRKAKSLNTDLVFIEYFP